MAALQGDVNERVRDRGDLCLGYQRQQFRDVVIVHRMHRREVRTSHPALQPEALGLIGQRLDVARMGVVGLIAMQVDHEAAFGGEFA